MRQSVSKGQEERALQDVKGWSSVITDRRAERNVKRTKVRVLSVRRVGRRVTEHMYA